jgi:hypothetical protein
MLEYLQLQYVGPAPEMTIELASRLNFITGDNGLGKTFLLDVAWWALTRTWARMPAAPHRRPRTKPSIIYRYNTAAGKKHAYESRFDRSKQIWPGRRGRPPIPGLVIYAQVDGGFSAWDPARNYWQQEDPEAPERPPAFLFQPDEVWNGLPREVAKKLCNGLIADWATWQREKGEAFEQLSRVLKRLSPSEGEPLVAGALTRISLDDVRDHPTLTMPYDQDVALVHASAGMRRIVALAYLLVWTWQEHLRACDILGRKPAREIIFLIDEIEAHLHPQWQRRIVPALLEVMEALTGKRDIPVQVITATHSPLVLASVEPYFDAQKDAIWELNLVNHHVELSRSPWRRYGDVNSWLSSSVFALSEPRSLEAERAIQKALALLGGTKRPTKQEIAATDKQLRGVLSDVDRFWVRWSSFAEKAQVKS